MTAALYKPEAEIARLVGMTTDEWEATATVLERSGLPQRDPLFGERRYWPAVRAFLDRRAGLMQDARISLSPDGEEDHHYELSRKRARA